MTYSYWWNWRIWLILYSVLHVLLSKVLMNSKIGPDTSAPHHAMTRRALCATRKSEDPMPRAPEMRRNYPPTSTPIGMDQSRSTMTWTVRNDEKLRKLSVLNKFDRPTEWRIATHSNTHQSHRAKWRKTTPFCWFTSAMTRDLSTVHVCAIVLDDVIILYHDRMHVRPQWR